MHDRKTLNALMWSRDVALGDKRTAEIAIEDAEHQIRQCILEDSSLRHCLKVDWSTLTKTLRTAP